MSSEMDDLALEKPGLLDTNTECGRGEGARLQAEQDYRPSNERLFHNGYASNDSVPG